MGAVMSCVHADGFRRVSTSVTESELHQHPPTSAAHTQLSDSSLDYRGVADGVTGSLFLQLFWFGSSPSLIFNLKP